MGGLKLKAGLYLVATPIGNLKDMSQRALETLSGVDLILCEDTRVTRKLTSHYSLVTPLQRYDEQATPAMREALAARISGGQAIALVSDAGSPLISDPGFKLVRLLREKGIFVTSVPGPCAAITALQISGLACDAFLFAGFLPTREAARRKRLESLAEVPATVIVYESGPRLLACLQAMRDIWGERSAAVARELTKLFEDCQFGTLGDLIEHFEFETPKGELVIVVEAARRTQWSDKQIDEALAALSGTESLKSISRDLAEVSGWAVRTIYQRALKQKNNF